MIKKSDFDKLFISEISKVPEKIRAEWREIDLMIWWNTERKNNIYLIPEFYKGDPWQYVNTLGKNMIGKS